jgi:hypothetical protein
LLLLSLTTTFTPVKATDQPYSTTTTTTTDSYGNPHTETRTQNVGQSTGIEYTRSATVLITMTASATRSVSNPNPQFDLIQWLAQNYALLYWIGGGYAALKLLYDTWKRKHRPFPDWEMVLDRVCTTLQRQKPLEQYQAPKI